MKNMSFFGGYSAEKTLLTNAALLQIHIE